MASVSLAEQLASLKLKKSALPTSDKSAPKLTGLPTETDVKSAHAQVLDCNLEVWFDALRDVTFPTALVPLAIGDAEWLCACYRDIKREGKLSADNDKRMQTMTASLQAVIEQTRAAPDSGVFVKLSCRSAKDSLAPAVLRTRYAQFAADAGLQPIIAQSGSALDQKSAATAATAGSSTSLSADAANSHLLALVRAATAVLQVTTAAEALHMIVTSDRIFEDLSLALANPSRFYQNIIVRRWMNIAADMEWRGFVHQNRLNALSQYNYITYFPRLAAPAPRTAHATASAAGSSDAASNATPSLADVIGRRILDFFNTSVRDKLSGLKYSNYVIDFAVSGSGDALDDTIWVIELNPWQPATDSGLFSFKTECDTVLANGPFEVRVRTECHPKIQAIWDSNQKQFMSAK